jgi:hypothetical protein
MPASRQPYKKAHDALMLYSLPERVRTLYGLRLGPAAKHAAQLTIALHRRLRPLIPAHVATGSCVASFKMVARAERQRIELGRHTPNLAERRLRATGWARRPGARGSTPPKIERCPTPSPLQSPSGC